MVHETDDPELLTRAQANLLIGQHELALAARHL